MSAGEDAERRARLARSFLAEPGDAVLGAALRARSATEILALTTGVGGAGDLARGLEPETDEVSKAMREWRRRISLLPSAACSCRWTSAPPDSSRTDAGGVRREAAER